MSNYLLDTSALLSFAGDEPGADTVEELLLASGKGQCRVLLLSLAVMEACSQVWLHQGEDAASLFYGRLVPLPIQLIETDGLLIWLASRIRALHDITFVQACMVAAAKRHNAILVHRDPGLDQFQNLIESFPLPK